MFLFLAATAGAGLAQQMRDRRLVYAYDLTNIQMPVEILSIKLKGREIQTGEKIQGDDDWLRGLSFTLKNVSDKPIAYINIGFQFPTSRGVVIYHLDYGVDYAHGDKRSSSSPPVISPGETLTLVLSPERYQVFQRMLSQAGASASFDTAPYFVEKISFEDDPDVIWAGGALRRRDPNNFWKFNVMERYVRPNRQK